jgi:hypothetical protein
VKEMILTSKIMRTTFGIFFALVVGIMLFISEFDFMRKLFALVFLPIAIYIIGKYLTLLPMALIIGITLISAFSLVNSEEGDAMFHWYGNIIGSVFEGVPGSSTGETSLSKKLLGFVLLSAVASFFIVFLV